MLTLMRITQFLLTNQVTFFIKIPTIFTTILRIQRASFYHPNHPDDHPNNPDDHPNNPDDHTNNPDNHNNPTDRTIQKTISLRGLPFKPLKPLQLLIHISSTAILAIIIFKPVNTTMLYRLIKTDIYTFQFVGYLITK